MTNVDVIRHCRIQDFFVSERCFHSMLVFLSYQNGNRRYLWLYCFSNEQVIILVHYSTMYFRLQYFLKYTCQLSNQLEMNSRCISWSMACTNIFCSHCNLMNRDQKFTQLLLAFEKCSRSMVYYDKIVSLVHQVRQVRF